GSAKGNGTLSNARLERVNVYEIGLAGSPSSAGWIRNDAVGSVILVDSKITEVRNDSTRFDVRVE
ncbi:MAG TPA: hypothetical protein VEA63_12850, partial [Opitutus sp.]|nr:hypothetical protein [Opitutus sp.]